MALGSQTKNRVCFVSRNLAYLSDLHSDLNKPGDFLNFTKSVSYFLKKKPKIIAYDLHPEYQSTKHLQRLSSLGALCLPVQHHHAHIVSCMIDNGLKNEKVIGVAFDGTGLGNDNMLWGGEFLVCNYKDFIRSAHLKEVPLLGGKKAISQPWRIAAFWLYATYKDKFLELDIGFVKRMNKNKWRILKTMYEKGLNTPSTSSMGRLFDAAASLILAKAQANFEAELAIELEKIAAGYSWSVCPAGREVAGYEFKIIKQKDKYIIDPAPLFKGVVSDLRKKETKGRIAYRFHLSVARMILEATLKIQRETAVKKVVFSGGVFQNRVLLKISLGLLKEAGLEVVIPKNFSCNDSGIALGQAVIAGIKA